MYDDALDSAQGTRDSASHAAGSLLYEEAERALARATELHGAGQFATATRQLWAADTRYAEAAAAADQAANARSAELSTPAASPPTIRSEVAPTTPPPTVEAPISGADEDAPAAIANALARYHAALEALDPVALESIFPAVPSATLEALGSYSRYAVDLVHQAPVVNGDTATVEARLSFSMSMKTGGTAEASGPAPFQLRREGDEWLIANIDMRGIAIR